MSLPTPGWCSMRSILTHLAALVLVLGLACSGGSHKSFDKKSFGGPYGVASDIRAQKTDDFTDYEEKKLSLSQPVELTRQLFAEGVLANRSNPSGNEVQRYNYVISTKGEVLIAVWLGDPDLAINGLVPGTCEKKDRFSAGQAGVIIDWYQEEPKNASRAQSPCWLYYLSKPLGILDAMSKHYMLSQGKYVTITSFDAKNWSNTKVAYAGEIIVDVSNCTYSLNSNSGTYRPSIRYLEKVKQHFVKEVKIPAQGIVPGCTPGP